MFESISSNFSSVFKKTLKGQLTAAVKTVAGSANNTLLSFLNEQLTSLRQSVDRSNQIIQIFTILSDTISPSDDAIINPNTIDISVITDRKDVIVEGCQFIYDTYGNMTFTDSFGLLYNFVFQPVHFVENGVDFMSYLSVTPTPTTIKQCIIYENLNNHEVFLNAVVRTADFIENTSIPVFVNLSSYLEFVSAIKGINYDGTLLSDGQSTILQHFQSLGGEGDTLSDLVRSAAVFPDIQGKVRLIWDLIKEYVASSELNSILLDAISAITQGQQTFNTWLSTISAYATSSVQCVKVFFQGLCTAYTSGGFKGAIMYIYEYFKVASSATDDDGLLVFTNNSSLVPTEYIVGMIGQLVSTAVSAAGAIIAFFQPIVGALVSLIGAVGMGIFKSLSYDSSATRCGIQTSDRVALNAAPFAICQGELDLEEDSDLQLFMNDTPVFSLEIPGGYLLCGPGGFGTGSNSNKVTKLRYEFHPSLVDRLDAISTFAASVAEVNISYSEYQYDSVIKYKTANSSVILKHAAFTTWFENVYCSTNSINEYVMTNSANDRLSEDDDSRMKKIILSNFWLFCYWACVMSVEDPTQNYTLLPESRGGEDYFCNITRTIATSTAYSVYLKTNVPANVLLGLAPLLDEEYTMYTWPIGWDDVVNNIVIPLSTESWLTFVCKYHITAKRYQGAPIAMPYAFDYALVPAKYNAETFLTWIIITAIITVAVAAIAVAVTLKVRKTIQNKRADQNRRVENAWDEYKKGNISYDDYRKTVKTANRWQTVIGGTKYDYENYWNGDQNIPSTPTQNNEQSTLSALRAVLNEPQNQVAVKEQSMDVNELFTKIFYSITG